jgi:hypothetical protein
MFYAFQKETLRPSLVLSYSSKFANYWHIYLHFTGHGCILLSEFLEITSIRSHERRLESKNSFTIATGADSGEGKLSSVPLDF